VGPRAGTRAAYQSVIDHYVEFWNESIRDIPLSELGPNPFLLIANQPGWNAGTLDSIPEGAGPPSRDFKLFLNAAKSAIDGSSFSSFPAGSVTVFTTDSAPLVALTPNSVKPHLYLVSIPPPVPNPLTYGSSGTTDLHTYSGQTNLKSGSQLRLNLKTRTTGSSDYETEMALGNDAGTIESSWGGAALTSTFSINADIGPDNRFDTTKWHFKARQLKEIVLRRPTPQPPTPGPMPSNSTST
jgi:hypothetical protein